MNITAIRHQLRQGQSESLKRRRKIALLSALGILDFIPISLYQLGIIRHMPDLPGKIFDSDKANGSKDAYIMGVPDGPISLVLYGLNIVLASAGGSAKSGRHPIFDVLLGGVILGSVVGGISYMYNMIFKQQKACIYCITGALLNFSMLRPLIPEVRKSLKQIFR
ncbi:vitamin K epoxide reductase family protein [Catalinimonas niigatensis]|uniref:vitamin K epoxide reductase family protein n=1 Tax=Catalinimonas niigatensis TaxID=1397264 RepID=UPI0026665EA8|nr:vitamin K epoxide reductase family protein [Catalinimonas niigatensis]WPP52258.1 vitamin K epoxide reductase family protein [Catalinimonas niigatensis]